MAPTNDNSVPGRSDLGSDAFEEIVQNSNTVGVQIQGFVCVVSRQRSISSYTRPKLEEDLGLVKASAKEWMEVYQPQLFQSLTNVRKFGNDLLGRMPILAKMARNLDDPGQRDRFISGVEDLRTKIQPMRDEAVQRKDRLLEFFDELSDGHGKMQKHVDAMTNQETNKVLLEMKERDVAFQSELAKSTKKTLDTLKTGRAGAAINLGLSVLSCVSIFGAAYLGASIYLYVQVDESIGKLEPVLAEALRRKKESLEKLYRLQDTIAFAELYRADMEGIAVNGQAAADAVLEERKGWNRLDRGFENLVKKLQRAELTSQLVSADLEVAQKGWKRVRGFAQTLRGNQVLPVQERRVEFPS